MRSLTVITSVLFLAQHSSAAPPFRPGVSPQTSSYLTNGADTSSYSAFQPVSHSVHPVCTLNCLLLTHQLTLPIAQRKLAAAQEPCSVGGTDVANPEEMLNGLHNGKFQAPHTFSRVLYAQMLQQCISNSNSIHAADERDAASAIGRRGAPNALSTPMKRADAGYVSYASYPGHDAYGGTSGTGYATGGTTLSDGGYADGAEAGGFSGYVPMTSYVGSEGYSPYPTAEDASTSAPDSSSSSDGEGTAGAPGGTGANEASDTASQSGDGEDASADDTSNTTQGPNVNSAATNDSGPDDSSNGNTDDSSNGNTDNSSDGDTEDNSDGDTNASSNGDTNDNSNGDTDGNSNSGTEDASNGDTDNDPGSGGDSASPAQDGDNSLTASTTVQNGDDPGATPASTNGDDNSGTAPTATDGSDPADNSSDGNSGGNGSDPNGVTASGTVDVPAASQSDDPSSGSSGDSSDDSSNDSNGDEPAATTSSDDTSPAASASVAADPASETASGTGDDDSSASAYTSFVPFGSYTSDGNTGASNGATNHISGGGSGIHHASHFPVGSAGHRGDSTAATSTNVNAVCFGLVCFDVEAGDDLSSSEAVATVPALGITSSSEKCDMDGDANFCVNLGS